MALVPLDRADVAFTKISVRPLPLCEGVWVRCEFEVQLRERKCRATHLPRMSEPIANSRGLASNSALFNF